jgi:phosphohistidine phosphatase
MHHGATPLALVGHEPSLSALAASLLGDAAAGSGKASGDMDPLLRLKKGGVVAVAWEGRGPASFRFLLDPKEMGVTVDLQVARKDK